MGNSNEEHDRWLIDQKLENTFRFEQRQMQLIGIVVIVIVILSPEFSQESTSSKILLSIIFIFVILLIIIYLMFALPRTAKKKLLPSVETEPTAELYKEFINELNNTMKTKAKLMSVSYGLFCVTLILLIIYVLFK